MTAAAVHGNDLTSKYLDPVLGSTQMVCETMLGCSVRCVDGGSESQMMPWHDVHSVIEISGTTSGRFILSVAKETALNVFDRFLGMTASELSDEVLDCVAEVANMISGNAKGALFEYDLAISAPQTTHGPVPTNCVPDGMQPICLSFSSEIGPFTIQFGFASDGSRRGDGRSL